MWSVASFLFTFQVCTTRFNNKNKGFFWGGNLLDLKVVYFLNLTQGLSFQAGLQLAILLP
jgi:hypothetical protein